MKSIFQSNNSLLDELEQLAGSKTKTYMPVRGASLTLKTRSNYLEANRTRSQVSGDRDIESIGAKTADRIEEASLNSVIARLFKRCCDLAGAMVGLVLTLPFWIIIPLLIKIDSRGPVFYIQTRVARNRRGFCRRLDSHHLAENKRHRERRREDSCGETFQVLKFRTMVDQAERDTGPVWAVKNDPRMTRVGSVLRKLRLDEIPQFLNVLAGDMSLIGPRPERPSFVRDLSAKIDNYHLRLEVKPGITGLAQIMGTYDSSPATVARKLKFDLEYIENWSLWLDAKILFKTVWVVLTGKGAH